MANSGSPMFHPSAENKENAFEANIRRRAVRECIQELNRFNNQNEQKAVIEAISYLQKLNTDEIKLEWSEGSERDLEKINKLRNLLNAAQALAIKVRKNYSKEFSDSIDAVLVVLTRFWPRHLKFEDGHFRSYADWEPITDENRILTFSGIELTTTELQRLIESRKLIHPIPGFKFIEREIDFLLHQAKQHQIKFNFEKVSEEWKRSVADEAFRTSTGVVYLSGLLLIFLLKIVWKLLEMLGLKRLPHFEREILLPAFSLLFSMTFLAMVHGHFKGKRLVKELTDNKTEPKSEKNQRIDFLLTSIMKQAVAPSINGLPSTLPSASPETRQIFSNTVIRNLLPPSASSSAVNTIAADEDEKDSLKPIDVNEKGRVNLVIRNRAAIQAEVQMRRRR